MRDFHVLQTEVNLMMDLTGRRMRIWGSSKGGREAHIASSIKDFETSGKLSDIATEKVAMSNNLLYLYVILIK